MSGTGRSLGSEAVGIGANHRRGVVVGLGRVPAPGGFVAGRIHEDGRACVFNQVQNPQGLGAGFQVKADGGVGERRIHPVDESHSPFVAFGAADGFPRQESLVVRASAVVVFADLGCGEVGDEDDGDGEVAVFQTVAGGVGAGKVGASGGDGLGVASEVDFGFHRAVAEGVGGDGVFGLLEGFAGFADVGGAQALAHGGQGRANQQAQDDEDDGEFHQSESSSRRFPLTTRPAAPAAGRAIRTLQRPLIQFARLRASVVQPAAGAAESCVPPLERRDEFRGGVESAAGAAESPVPPLERRDEYC